MSSCPELYAISDLPCAATLTRLTDTQDYRKPTEKWAIVEQSMPPVAHPGEKLLVYNILLFASYAVRGSAAS